MNKLERCGPETFCDLKLYPDVCIACRAAKEFTDKLHRKLREEYEMSDIAKTIAREKAKMSDLDERFSAIEAKIDEYNLTHDESHSANMYKPWECYPNCAGCIRDEVKSETATEIAALKSELAEVKKQLAEMRRLTSQLVVYK